MKIKVKHINHKGKPVIIPVINAKKNLVKRIQEEALTV